MATIAAPNRTTSNIPAMEWLQKNRPSAFLGVSLLLEKPLALIPGTSGFRRQYVTTSRDVLKKVLAIFNGIQSLDEKQKHDLRLTVRRDIMPFARAAATISAFQASLVALQTILAPLLVLITPLIGFLAIESNLGILALIGAYLMCVLGNALGVLATRGVDRIARRLCSGFFPYPMSLVAANAASLILLFLGAFLVFRVLFDGELTSVGFRPLALGVSLFATCIVLFAGMVFLAFYELVCMLFERRFCRLHPESVLTIALLEALDWIDNHPSRWRIGCKSDAIEILEDAAFALEYGMPYCVNRSDKTTAHWFRSRMREFAEQLRELKKWILTPKPDTREHLIARVLLFFRCAVTGRWDGLEMLNVSPNDPPKSIGRRVFRIAGAIAMATIPLLVFYVLRSCGFEPQGTIGDTLRIVVFAWTTISLLSAFDSQLAPKLSMLKKLGQLLGATKP